MLLFSLMLSRRLLQLLLKLSLQFLFNEPPAVFLPLSKPNVRQLSPSSLLFCTDPFHPLLMLLWLPLFLMLLPVLRLRLILLLLS
jgi:hypothetical protein